MLIKRLDIENWKNFKVSSVKIGRRLFLIGPNASGKSNFLDIFRFLKEICMPGGGLTQAVKQRGGVSNLRCFWARRRNEISVKLFLEEESDQWTYLLKFKQDKQRRPIITREVVTHNEKLILNRPDDDDKEDEERLIQTSIEQISVNKEFRKIVNYFKSVSYQQLLPQVIRDPQGFSPAAVKNDPYGRDFLQRVETTTPKFKISRLNKILEALKIAVPNLSKLQTERDKYGIPHLVGQFENWRPNAGNQNEVFFSDGTLRLFGFLWSLFEGDGLLLLEEPELSLHQDVVKHIPEMIETINTRRRIKRQVIISTHSEAMLQNDSIGGEEVLMFNPTVEGSEIKSPVDYPEIIEGLKAGLTVGDIVYPKTAPKNIEQLGLLK